MAKDKTKKIVKLSGGKRLTAARAEVKPDNLYNLDDAIKIVKKNATAKFDETIEIAFNLGIDPRHSDQSVRGVIAMPNGVGKNVRVAVFARDAKAEEAKSAGADVVGADDLVEEISKGKLDFDRCIATPDMMSVVGKVAKILGPRGLMPNPKLGTVTKNVTDAVKAAKSGQVEFRAEKAGIVHAGIGKASFSEKDLKENITALIEAVNKAKPSGSKGIYIKRVAIASTMGLGIQLDVSTLSAA